MITYMFVGALIGLGAGAGIAAVMFLMWHGIGGDKWVDALGGMFVCGVIGAVVGAVLGAIVRAIIVGLIWLVEGGHIR